MTFWVFFWFHFVEEAHHDRRQFHDVVDHQVSWIDAGLLGKLTTATTFYLLILRNNLNFNTILHFTHHSARKKPIPYQRSSPYDSYDGWESS